DLPNSVPDLWPRVRWEVGIGFALLLVGCMGVEALRLGTWAGHLPAGAGGQLGQLLAGALAQLMGHAGSTLLLLAFVVMGSSLFFGFSWLDISVKNGLWIERGFRRLVELKTGYEDRRVGASMSAARPATVESRP